LPFYPAPLTAATNMNDVQELAALFNGEILSEEIARHEWDRRFEPMRANVSPLL
jgi:hypothetical protein